MRERNGERHSEFKERLESGTILLHEGLLTAVFIGENLHQGGDSILGESLHRDTSSV